MKKFFSEIYDWCCIIACCVGVILLGLIALCFVALFYFILCSPAIAITYMILEKV